MKINKWKTWQDNAVSTLKQLSAITARSKIVITAFPGCFTVRNILFENILGVRIHDIFMWRAICRVLRWQITLQGSSGWGHLFLRKGGLSGARVHITEKRNGLTYWCWKVSFRISSANKSCYRWWLKAILMNLLSLALLLFWILSADVSFGCKMEPSRPDDWIVLSMGFWDRIPINPLPQTATFKQRLGQRAVFGGDANPGNRRQTLQAIKQEGTLWEGRSSSWSALLVTGAQPPQDLQRNYKNVPKKCLPGNRRGGTLLQLP